MLPKLITSLLGSRARAIIERDGQVISPSSTRSYPLVAERGEGAIVEDPGGNRFPGLRRGIAVVAEKLAGLVDKGSPRRVYLGNSGTEAVEAPSSWLGTSSGGGSSWRSWVPFTVESWGHWH